MATLTVYPDAGTGATTVDGFIGRVSGTNITWSDLHDGAGTGVFTTSDNQIATYLQTGSASNTYRQLYHAIYTFDTSSIGASSVVTAATMSLFGIFKTNSLNSLDNMHIGGATPAANNDLQTTDYGNVERTSFGSITYASFSTSAYNDITLNGTGLAYINKTGITRLSAQLESDITNTPPTWSSSKDVDMEAYYADHAGTSNDPKLVVTYTQTEIFFGLAVHASIPSTNIQVINEVFEY